MTTAEQEVTGKILEISRQDGESAKGPWTKWGFNIQHTNGEKHWYSWFSVDGALIKTNQTYMVSFTTSPNPKSAEHPYRNITAVSEPSFSDDEMFAGKPEPGQERTVSPNAGMVEQDKYQLSAARRDAMILIEMGVWEIPEGRNPLSWVRECSARLFYLHHATEMEPKHYCYLHETPRRATKSGSYVHEVGDQWCSEDGLYDAEGTPVAEPIDDLPF